MCLSSYHVNIEATPTTYYYFLSDQAILEIKKKITRVQYSLRQICNSVKNDKSTCMPRVWKIIDIGVSRTPLITSLDTPHL